MVKRLFKTAITARLRIYISLLAVLYMLVNTSGVSALIAPDIYQQLQWPWYVPSGSSSSGCVTNLVGSDNAEKIWNYLKDTRGLTPMQAAGIMGNMMHESALEPERLQGTSGKTSAEILNGSQLSLGWGIVQWTPATKIINNATPITTANDLGFQLDFLWAQLEGKGPEPESTQILADIKSTAAIRDAVLAFQGNLQVGGHYLGYERPADESGSINDRTQFATDFFNLYGSSGGGAGGGSCGSSGSYALPVDHHWYDEHKDWFTKPHHDYPAADIPVPEGTEVFSASSGIVTIINDDLCGKGINVDAGEGIIFTYCHSSDSGSITGVKDGDQVQPGQLIMHVDTTGHASGPHLHFGIKVGNTRVCPQNFLVDVAEGRTPDIKSLPSSGCTN